MTRSPSRWSRALEEPRRRARRTTLVGADHHQLGRDVVDRESGLMQPRQHHLLRLARVERRRRIRGVDQRARYRAEDRQVHDRSKPKVFTDDGREVVPGSDEVGHARGRRSHPARLLQGPEKTAATFRRRRRQALVGPGRLRHRRGRRHDHAARPRLGVHQLRRREDLPRGGRGSGEAHPDVADVVVVGVPDDRFGEASPRSWRRRRAERPTRTRSPRRSSAAASPASSDRSTSSSSTPCLAAPTAKPTTPGPAKRLWPTSVRSPDFSPNTRASPCGFWV